MAFEDEDEYLAPMDIPNRDELRKKLYGNLVDRLNGRGSRDLAESQKEIADTDRQNAFIASLNKSANQIGSIGSHVADSSPVSDMAKSVATENQQELGTLAQDQDRKDKVQNYLLGQIQRSDEVDARMKAQAKARQEALEAGAAKQKSDQDFHASENRKKQEADLMRMREQNQFLASITDTKLQAAADKTSPAAQQFKNMPKDEQDVLVDLAKKNASKLSIKNQIDAELKNMQAAIGRGDEDMAVASGRNMLKVLNSTEGADAVGADEAKRLGSFLEYKMLNLRQPGSFIGRDIDKFVEMAQDKSNAIGGAIRSNQAIVDSIKNGKGVPMPQDVVRGTPEPVAEPGTAHAAPNPGAHPQSDAAMLWARSHPNDPRAAVILQRLGGK